MHLLVGAWPVAQVPGLAGGVGRAAKAINAGQPCNTVLNARNTCHAVSIVLYCLQATARFHLYSAQAGMGIAHADAVIDHLLRRSAAGALIARAQASCFIEHIWAGRHFPSKAVELHGSKA